MEYISYNGVAAGITNQKLALIGLAHKALREKKGIKLPPLVMFDPQSREPRPRVDFASVFDVRYICYVLNAFSIPVKYGPDDDYQEVDSSACFWEGAERFGETKILGDMALYGLTCQLTRAFILNDTIEEIATIIGDGIFQDRDIKHVIQMRVEKDWEDYSHSVLSPVKYEDNLLAPSAILAKAKNKFGYLLSSALILCDEDNMPYSKEEIRIIAKKDFNIYLYWKSDFINIREYDTLTLSLIDFSLSLKAPFFVGTCKSTFSCFSAFEKYCKERHDTLNHFIYNGQAPELEERFDNGTSTDSRIATKNFFGRKCLMPRHEKEIALPVRLSAHISNIGDFHTQSSVASFPEGIPVVVGYFENTARFRIEGFELHINPENLRIRYKAVLLNGRTSDWVANGVYCGTRGEGMPLVGFAIEIVGPESLELDCVYAAQFSSGEIITEVKNGEMCRSTSGIEKLISMQVSFRKKKFKNS